MDRLGWPVAAKIQRKWFAGELNYANTDDGARIGINQNGQPFQPSMIDTTTIKMDWVLKFPRAKARLDELLNEKLFNRRAIDTLKHMARRWKSSPYVIDAWERCEGDWQKYHREYQYQLVRVDDDWVSKGLMLAAGAATPILMDDLYGALGAFTFNAALSKFSYCNGQLKIFEVNYYVRDVFTFHDRKDGTAASAGSQYLGNWNEYGLIVVPSYAMLGEVSKAHMPHVARNAKITKDNLFYTVRNLDYREWQLIHGQGGDLVLYSNRYRTYFGYREPIVIEVDR